MKKHTPAPGLFPGRRNASRASRIDCYERAQTKFCGMNCARRHIIGNITANTRQIPAAALVGAFREGSSYEPRKNTSKGPAPVLSVAGQDRGHRRPDFQGRGSQAMQRQIIKNSLCQNPVRARRKAVFYCTFSASSRAAGESSIHASSKSRSKGVRLAFSSISGRLRRVISSARRRRHRSISLWFPPAEPLVRIRP